jgi:hypothetical protein
MAVMFYILQKMALNKVTYLEASITIPKFETVLSGASVTPTSQVHTYTIFITGFRKWHNVHTKVESGDAH